jgi:hypothetical protein
LQFYGALSNFALCLWSSNLNLPMSVLILILIQNNFKFVVNDIVNPFRSGDGTAKLWPITDNGLGISITLEHKTKDHQENHNTAPTNLDVTSLEWNVSYCVCKLCRVFKQSFD